MPEPVQLELQLDGEFHLHHHYHHNPSQPGAADILNSIQGLKGTIMTALSDAIAELKADDAQLESEIDEVLGKLAQVPGEIAAAVQTALDNAGVDSAVAAAAVQDIDDGVKASLAKVTDVLNPPAPEPVVAVDPEPAPAETTASPETGDTLTGGTGDDSDQV